MTLCIAWVRQDKKGQELIFATDSCLGAGERWDSGVKLFELPRKDCLICFSGYTLRTYPLILNLINSLKFDRFAANPNYDVNDLVNYITDLFTDLIKKITTQGLNPPKTFEEVIKDDPEFDFLFGGWSWKENKFKLWRIYYSYDAKGFLPETNYDNLVLSMIGDGLDTAKKLIEKELVDNGKVLVGTLDMEPLKALVNIIRDESPQLSIINGPIQFAKIYPPGITEFFGLYYPSIKGKKTFLGRDVSKTNNPSVRFIDPDTGYIADIDLPNNIECIDNDFFDIDKEFIDICYPNNKLKEEITEREIEILKSFFKDFSYNLFIKELSSRQKKVDGTENE